MTGLRVAAVVGGAVLAGAACGGGSASSPAAAQASAGAPTATSHNAGRDCTACHRDFAIAGTVYRADGVTPLSGATIRLTTAPDGGGSVIATLSSDGSGNFRASQSVGFGSGVYADAAGPGGARSAMQAALTSGGCNSCHDSSRRITAQ